MTIRRICTRSVACVTGIVFVWFLFFYEPSVPDPFPTMQERPYIVPHAGYGTSAPESSLEATRRALESGSRFIDLDVRLSRDGVPMVVHDPQITRDGTRTYVGDVDSEGLEETPISSPRGYDGPPQFIRSLREHLTLVQPHEVFLIIEFKDWYGERARRVEKETLLLLSEFGVSNRTVVVSAHPLAICRLNTYPDIRTMYTFVDYAYYEPATERGIRRGDIVGSAFYRLPYLFRFEPIRRAVRKVCRPDAIAAQRDVPEHILQTLTEAGYPVFVWDLFTKEDIEQTWASEPFALVVDAP